jgi:preprotein translocase subunit SecA
MSEAAALRLPRLPFPGARARSERPAEGLLAWAAGRLASLGAGARRRRAFRVARRADAQEAAMQALDEAQLDAAIARLARRLRCEGLHAATEAQALALLRETCRRTRGLTPYTQQLAGAQALLHGAVIEMDTGEGKTLTALIAAAIQGLAGRHVHVVTVNDYLAERDAEAARPVLARLGLTSGLVVNGVAPEARRAAYAADITFVSNKEVAFDHLRDRLLAGGGADAPLLAKARRALAGAQDPAAPVQRGLDVAIVDEADSVLVDEAATPLLISSAEGPGLPPGAAERMLDIARNLTERLHWEGDPHGIGTELTPLGRAAVAEALRGEPGPWAMRVRREEMLRAALSALHRLERDRHYILREGKIVIVDENTGRPMPDRFWTQDLQQMVEAKEGLAASGQRRSLASISFQRFFRRYATLAGMSGTVAEVAPELARVYGLRPVRIPRRRPLRRVTPPPVIFPDRDSLWRAAAARAAACQARGQPMLIGTRTVAEAARASAALTKAGVAHVVLSAAQDAAEADIIARAGQPGAVTVATNMAGRGTDILLAPGVAKAGGLLVLLSERHDSRRVDRQLMGRCARQGDPGVAVEFLSREDRLLELAGPWLRRLGGLPLLGRRATLLAFARAQRRAEAEGLRRRVELVRRDEQLSKLLGFAGGLD